MKVLITGGNGGLGAPLAQWYHDRGHSVHITCRRLEGLIPGAVVYGNVQLPLDIDHLLELIGPLPFDRLIHCAALMERNRWDFSLKDVNDCMQVNALAPLELTLRMRRNLTRGAKVVNVSSIMGSIASVMNGGYYGYRLSKAALNMATKTLSIELGSEVSIYSIHPGWVKTKLGGPAAPLKPEVAAQLLGGFIEKLTPEQTGKFFDATTGEELPW